MEEFFGKALDVAKGNRGVIPIVVIFAFSAIVTLILSKTIALNQSQSYDVLLFVFVGLMVFLIFVYALFLKPIETTDDNESKQADQRAETDGDNSGIKQETDVRSDKQYAKTGGNNSPLSQTKRSN